MEQRFGVAEMLQIVLRYLDELFEDQPGELFLEGFFLQLHLDHLIEKCFDTEERRNLNLEQFINVELCNFRIPQEKIKHLGLDDVHDILADLGHYGNQALAVDLAALEAEELLVDQVELDEGHDQLEFVGVRLFETVEEVAQDSGEEGTVVFVLELFDVSVAAVLADQHVYLL